MFVSSCNSGTFSAPRLAYESSASIFSLSGVFISSAIKFCASSLREGDLDRSGEEEEEEEARYGMDGIGRKVSVDGGDDNEDSNGFVC